MIGLALGALALGGLIFLGIEDEEDAPQKGEEAEKPKKPTKRTKQARSSAKAIPKKGDVTAAQWWAKYGANPRVKGWLKKNPPPEGVSEQEHAFAALPVGKAWVERGGDV